MSTALTADYNYLPNVVIANWANLAASENGDAAELCAYNDKTVSIIGTFGGAVTIQGSDDGTNWVGLKDAQTGSAISATANGMFVIKENPKYIRPAAASGVGGVSVTITGKKGAR